MKKRTSEGFTLVELVLAIALSAIVFVGLASVHGNFSIHQMANYRTVMIQNQASYAASLMRKDLGQADFLKSPPPAGGFADYLLGGMNVSHDGLSKIVDTEPQTWFYYCVNGPEDERQLFRFTGPWPPPTAINPPANPAACAALIPSQYTTKDTVAGYPIGTVTFDGGIFRRPPGQDNVVWTYFTVALVPKPGRQPLSKDVNVEMALGMPTQTAD